MSDASPRAARDYKDTLFLPDTDFPMRAGLPKKEPELLRRWAEQGLYEQLRADAKGRPTFVLHDGPPYANGHIHMGTGLTKILKDMIVRSRQMTGFDANFVPGWDCHGLPIEWKVEEEFRANGRAKRDVPPSEFRARCREYAQGWLDIQSAEFQRLGGAGDWKTPYSTMAFSSEATIAGELLKFRDLGLLYRGSKPVMWSPVEQTALAEAEIEYHDHQSTTIWVKFPLAGRTSRGGTGQEVFDRSDALWEMRSASVVIWTTTPWTIPGNRAICYGPELSYGLYEVAEMKADLDFEPWSKPGDRLIVGDALAESVREAGLIAEWTRVADVPAATLAGAVCRHPLRGLEGGYGFDVPLLAGDHVTDEAGTGFVHTAPSHGAEDFDAWRAHGQPLEDIPHTVDEFGAYTREAPGFEGKKVLVTEGKKKGKDGDANKAVIDALIARGGLLARGRLTHSYPHSWRSKAPVIFRNTPQWFIGIDRPTANGKTLRENALAAIEETEFVPASGRNRLRAMVATRPDWLISRQRAWGVPLPLFVNRDTGELLADASVDARVLAAIAARGADAWFDTPKAELLGADHDADAYEQVTDILDVWFDSGTTHVFVLENRPDLTWPADVYCEGSDQHRGWFQSSLLHSCGTRGRAPYRKVITNGFVVDGEGRKMSKSLGNVVAPEEIIQQYGAEIIRIWAASGDYTEDPRVGKEIIDSAVDAYRKLRNTIRYLLGALKGFSDAEAADLADMPELERYILHRLAVLDAEVRDAYEQFDFKRVWRRTLDFAAFDLSAFQLDIRKDALYCDAADSPRRRAARTVMSAAFDRLTAWLAPICAFTMEEAWMARHGEAARSVHLRQFPETPAEWRDDALAARWDALRRVRRVATGALELARREKRIGSSNEAAITLHLSTDELRAVVAGRDLAELFITGAVDLAAGDGPQGAFRMDDAPGVAVIVSEAGGEKCERCWRYTGDVGAEIDRPDLCGRCAGVVDRFDAGAA
ncbi:MAG: isoleucine--tRNA ligase [Alphaproteobacteria bacterium]|nr:isoleucine--tRNA ligase [Alphaproteobacteria bacterium]